MAAGQNYGRSTASLMDKPLAIRSVFAPYFGDNGYKFNNAHSIRVLNTPNGTLKGYKEASTSPISVGLVQTDTQDLDIEYSQAMFERIQRTLIQDIPVKNFVADWAKQQIEQVFIPTHDSYSIGKLIAARPVANREEFDDSALGTDSAPKLTYVFSNALNKIRKKGADPTQVVALLGYSFAATLASQINFTGSDRGYGKGENSSYLGKHRGVTVVEVPEEYFPNGADNDPKYHIVHGVLADKRAIINVTPKMSPNDYKIVRELSGFDGVEVQIRDRADTFVLDKKKDAIVTLESQSKTSTAATPVYTTATTV